MCWTLNTNTGNIRTIDYEWTIQKVFYNQSSIFPLPDAARYIIPAFRTVSDYIANIAIYEALEVS